MQSQRRSNVDPRWGRRHALLTFSETVAPENASNVGSRPFLGHSFVSTMRWGYVSPILGKVWTHCLSRYRAFADNSDCCGRRSNWAVPDCRVGRGLGQAGVCAGGHAEKLRSLQRGHKGVLFQTSRASHFVHSLFLCLLSGFSGPSS